VGFALDELKGGEEEEKQQEGLGIAGKSSIKKIVGGVGALALIGAGTATALSDLSGDGLATYRQLPIIGDVEGNPLEYDTSGDGIDDGTVHEMGLSPAESHPAVSEALKGGIDTDQARFFEGMNQRYVEEAAGYLAENPGKLDAVLVDGEASELGTKYAENFSPKALANLSRLGNTTGSNVDFAETLLDLPEDVHAELAEDYTEDGVASLRERNQAKFLNLLQENNQLRDFLQEYDPANANVSDDGFTNYFSLTRSDVIDWDVQNRRFVIDTLPLAADDYSVSVSDDFVERVGDFYEKNMRIPENQIYRLLGEDATWENFQKVTDELQGRMDEDDILVWSAGGEGSAGTYGFYAEGPGSTYGASYIYIDNELDEIPGKQVAVLNACFAGSAIEIPEEGIRGPAEPMADEDRTILASSGPTEETWGTFFLEDFYENMSKARGGIYPSFGEVFEEISDMSSQTPQIHNRDLAEELYLGIPGETEV